MLAGVDDLVLESAMRLQGAHDGRDLHEVGTCAGDEVEDGHGLGEVRELATRGDEHAALVHDVAVRLPSIEVARALQIDRGVEAAGRAPAVGPRGLHLRLPTGRRCYCNLMLKTPSNTHSKTIHRTKP